VKVDRADFRDAIRRARSGTSRPDDMVWVAEGAASGSLPDYQLAAWLMAVYIRGLDDGLTVALTRAMAASGGDPARHPGRVDKHSTGGVGDKTTLVVAPLVASFGVPVAKMSGRGLGHTGGTLDKLESIPGFDVHLSRERLAALVQEVGVAVAAQSGELAPADGRLYALRDATATVEALPLIASSIMAKKLAGGAPALVLDVKVGRGAFMPDLESARALARLMVHIGREAGLAARALLTNMDQPLGWAVGNAVEVNEAVDTLRGQGPPDFVELVVAVAQAMLAVAGVNATPEAVRARLDSGRAYDQFQRWIVAQGGRGDAFDGQGHLPLADRRRVVEAPSSARVARVDPIGVGEAALHLGAGRLHKDDRVDPAVGVRVLVKVGQQVDRGDPVAEVYARVDRAAEAAVRRLEAAFGWGEPDRVWPTVLDRLE